MEYERDIRLNDDQLRRFYLDSVSKMNVARGDGLKFLRELKFLQGRELGIVGPLDEREYPKLFRYFQDIFGSDMGIYGINEDFGEIE